MNKKSENKVISIDIGATSGRIMEVTLTEQKIFYKEINRFSNKVFKENGNLYWDINYLIEQIFITLKKVNKDVKSLAISTWGCDICLIDKNGHLIDNPRCYRDEHNMLVKNEFEQKYFSYNEIYNITGIQNLPFNTIYQLIYLRDAEPDLYEKIDKVLMIPDYIAYVLTGKMRTEETNASTTALYDFKKKSFSEELFDKLKIKKNIFPPLIYAGESYGLLKQELQEKFKLNNLEIIACATHDTGSAVRGSLQDDNTAYLSSGTWSLLGTLINGPIKNDLAKCENYTNEIGYNSKIRFLKNIMGMWILEEYRRELANENQDNSFETILKEFKEENEVITLINPDDDLFLPVGKMSPRIDQYAIKTNQITPKTRKEYIQTIYYSLAFKYRYVIEKLEKITNQKYERLNIVGGGSKNDLLSQIIADIMQIEVIAGPVEATILGNAIVQFIHYDLIAEKDVQTIIINSDDNIKTFKPNYHLKDYYNSKYKKFMTLMEVK